MCIRDRPHTPQAGAKPLALARVGGVNRVCKRARARGRSVHFFIIPVGDNVKKSCVCGGWEDASTPRLLDSRRCCRGGDLHWIFARRSTAVAVVGGLVTQFDVVLACKLQQLMLQTLCISSLQNCCTCAQLWISLAPCSFWPCGMCLDAASNEHVRLERGSNPRQVDVHGHWPWRS